MTDPKRSLDRLFAAERQKLRAEADLLSASKNSLRRTLVSAVAEARAIGTRDPDEREMRLRCLADLCAQAPSPETVDAMIDILDDESVPVRVEAGDALQDVAFEYLAEVGRAIERALERSRRGPAMLELPHVLAEIHEESVLALMLRFLETDDAEIIASTIEALVSREDPEAADAIARFVDDKRTVAGEVDGDPPVSIGELARDAVSMLRS